MALTPQSCITEARGLLNDTVATYRYDDADMLKYFNDALKEMAKLPATEMYFSKVGEMECVAGQTRQQVSFDDTLKLLDLVRIKNGAVPLPADKAALDAFNPSWHADDEGVAKNWMPDATSPIRFYIYPKAPVNQILEVRYVGIPADVAIGNIAVSISDYPATWLPAIADYICYRCEMREDEYAVQGKAAGFYASFLAKIGAA